MSLRKEPEVYRQTKGRWFYFTAGMAFGGWMMCGLRLSNDPIIAIISLAVSAFMILMAALFMKAIGFLQ